MHLQSSSDDVDTKPKKETKATKDRDLGSFSKESADKQTLLGFYCLYVEILISPRTLLPWDE